jgi:transcriptional regulator with XRE-family HTH domain
MNNFKENLKGLRLEMGLTQKELAKNLSVLERTVSYWENGERECDFDSLIRISKFFGVPIDDLLL